MTWISFNVSTVIVDIGRVIISPSGPVIEVSQESFSLDCSLNLSSNSLPQGVPAPSLVWFNSTDSYLPDGVMMSTTMLRSSITYTHTLHFSPLQESHMGIYTCQIEGNNRQSANISITICTYLPTILVVLSTYRVCFSFCTDQ